MAKTLNTRVQYKIDSEANWNSAGFTSLEGELYVYDVDDKHDYTRLKIGDGALTVAELPFCQIGEQGFKPSTELTKINVPAQRGTLTYNGGLQTPSWNNTEHVTISGFVTGTNAGTYTATFTPKSGYCWMDESTGQKTATWTIDKATPTIVFGTSSITPQPELTELSLITEESRKLTLFTDSYIPRSYPSIYVTFNGAAITLNSFTQNSTGNMDVDFTAVAAGTTTIVAGVEGTSNWNSCTATLIVNVTEPKTLNDYTWEEIKEIAESGNAPNVFEIGEYKEIKTTSGVSINDTFNSSSILSLYAVILGFDHANLLGTYAPNTIDFGFPYTLENGVIKACAFTDYNYGNQQSYQNSGFCINSSQYEEPFGDGTCLDPNWNGSSTCSIQKCLSSIFNTISSKTGIPLLNMGVGSASFSMSECWIPDDSDLMYGGTWENTVSASNNTGSYKIKLLSAKEMGLEFTPGDIVVGGGSPTSGDDTYRDYSVKYPYFDNGNRLRNSRFYKLTTQGRQEEFASIWLRESCYLDSTDGDSPTTYSTYSLSYVTKNDDGRNNNIFTADVLGNSPTILEFVSPNTSLGIFTVFRVGQE